MKPGDNEYNLLRKKALIAIAGLRKMRHTSHVPGRTFVVSPEFQTEVIEPIEKLYEIFFGEKTPEDKVVVEVVGRSFEEHEKFVSSQPLGSPTGSVWRFIRKSLAIATVGAIGTAVYVAWQGNKRKKRKRQRIKKRFLLNESLIFTSRQFRV